MVFTHGPSATPSLFGNGRWHWYNLVVQTSLAADFAQAYTCCETTFSRTRAADNDQSKLALDEIVEANIKGKHGELDPIEKICVSPIFLQ